MRVTQQEETIGDRSRALANVEGTNVGHSYKEENYI
jgi:hypothetical protein